MAWARYESAFVKHPKVQRIDPNLRPDAIALHIAATGYCADLLTDGLIPKAVIPDLARVCGIKRHRKVLDSLLKQRLFLTPNRTEIERVRVKYGVALEPDDRSLLVNDYLEYNPSRHAVIQERERAAERQRRSRESKKQGVLPLDVTDERHSVTSQRESREKSQRSARASRAHVPSHPLESVSSSRGEGLPREPAAQQAAPAPTPNGTTAIIRARLRIHAIGHELPANELDNELRDFLRDRYTDLTTDDLHELAAIHQALLDPEPTP